MELTKASSKGRVVIPANIRKRLDIKKGSVLAVSAERDMIVMKKIGSGLSAADLRSLKLTEEAWRDIEEGRYCVSSKEAFLVLGSLRLTQPTHLPSGLLLGESEPSAAPSPRSIVFGFL